MIVELSGVGGGCGGRRSGKRQLMPCVERGLSGVGVTVLIDQDYLVVVLLEFYFLARAGTQKLLAEVISTVA